MLRSTCLCVLATGIVLSLAGCPAIDDSLTNAAVRGGLADANVSAIEKPAANAAQVELGQMLFFDKELSGNRNISCATCHHPAAFTGDGLAVSKGQGGVGLGTSRSAPLDENDNPILIPRNAPQLFNLAAFDVMFWDGRVSRASDGALLSPAKENLLPGLTSPAAVQAMFPVTSADEMRGRGDQNDLSMLADNDFQGMWTILINRLMAIDEYRQMFAAAYPDKSLDLMTFADAANAIAAFEIDAYTLDDAPLDQFLRGDDSALSDAEKRGALLFFGDAGCARCHSGPLLTDQQFHNRCVPQIGDGKGDGPDGTWDFGRGRETKTEQDMYAFRTPSLRNVAFNGPWMHDGAFATLEGAVLHCADPLASMTAYDPTQLAPDMQPTVRAEQTDAILAAADPNDLQAVSLSPAQVADIVAFLNSLSSPSLSTLATRDVPARVPSGLPLAD